MTPLAALAVPIRIGAVRRMHVIWRGGRTIEIAPQAQESVAYAIDAAHRTIGSLIGRDGRHYAFIWEDDHLHLLDEIASQPGWRFEGAYRFVVPMAGLLVSERTTA